MDYLIITINNTINDIAVLYNQHIITSFIDFVKNLTDLYEKLDSETLKSFVIDCSYKLLILIQYIIKNIIVILESLVIILTPYISLLISYILSLSIKTVLTGNCILVLFRSYLIISIV